MKFYTYIWLREDKTPYYVGKGSGNRAWDSHPGHRPPGNDHIQVQYWKDEATAYAFEVYLIDYWGRKDLGTGVLRNLTDGGEGPFGLIRTTEHNKKIGDALRGRKAKPLTSETIARIAAANRGKKRTAAFKESQSERFKGEKNPNFGRVTPESTRDKMAESHRGEKNWTFGKPLGAGHVAALSRSIKQGFARGRVNASKGKTGENSYMSGRVWLTDGIKSRRVPAAEMENFIASGWRRGRVSR